VCRYKESLNNTSIIENTVYNCRIKENHKKLLSSKMILYYLSLRLSGDELQRPKETTVK